MATRTASKTNGVSMAAMYTAVAQDDTDGEIIFDFDMSYDIIANIMVTDASDVLVDMADAVVDYPAPGQVRVQDGAATFAITAGQNFHVVAQRRVVAQ